MHCNDGLNNKLVESLVENKVAQETGDLKYLQDSMYDFVSTLKDIILGEYSPEFFNKYVDEALKLHGSNLEEFLKIPKMGLELRQALNSIDDAIDTSNQDFKDNLVLLLDRFQTTLDGIVFEARSPYEIAVKYGFVGTEEEWLSNILNSSETAHNIFQDAKTFADFLYKPADFMVARRLAPSVHTLDYFLNTFDSEVGRVAFNSNEAIASINATVDTVNDNYNASQELLNNVSDKYNEAIDTVNNLEPTVIGLVNDAIDNTAIEGGILADTFVTVTTNAVGSVARTQRDKNADTLNAKDFGASPSIANNTPALTKAAQAASLLNIPLEINEIYPCTTILTLPDNLQILGSDRMKSGITGTASVTVKCGSGVTFKSLSLLNSAKNHISVLSENVDAPVFRDCYINGRVDTKTSTLNTYKAPRFFSCHIDCDFGADYNGIEQMDVFSVYGLQNPIFHDCDIDVANVHRIWKFSQGLGEPLAREVGQTIVRNVIIKDCRISGYGGKQCIDSFYGTSGILISGNTLALTDEECISGVKFTNFFENKTVANSKGETDVGVNLLMENNTGFVACGLILMQGSYGIIGEGQTKDRRDEISLLNNNVIRTTKSTTAFVEFRRCHKVTSLGNTFTINGTRDIPSVTLTSNLSVVIGGGESYSGGFLLAATSTGVPDGAAFTGKTGSIEIDKLSILNFDAYAAITFRGLDADLIHIKDTKSVAATDSTNASRAVSSGPTQRIGSFIIDNFHATHQSGGNVQPLLDEPARTNLTLVDCSWLPRFRGFVTTPPSSGTYVAGDTLKNSVTYMGGVSEWVCVTGNDSGGFWRASSYTVTKSSTAIRPKLTNKDSGVMYMDTTLSPQGKPIWWTGTAWVDATGVVV